MVNLDYLYKPVVAKPYFEKNYLIDRKLSFRVVENGTILPQTSHTVNGKWTWGKGGIVDSNGSFIKGTFIKSELNGFYTPPQR